VALEERARGVSHPLPARSRRGELELGEFEESAIPWRLGGNPALRGILTSAHSMQRRIECAERRNARRGENISCSSRGRPAQRFSADSPVR
jgi:hypothetical protein